MAPFIWTEVTLPWSMETMPQESQKSHTWSSRTHPRDAMSATQSEGWPTTTAIKATTTVEALVTPPWEVRPHWPLSNSQPLCPPPRFVEIAQTLKKEEPMESSLPPVVTSILTQEVINSYKVMGMAVMAARLLWNQTTGEMLMDIHVCSQGIVGLELNPKVDRCPFLTLQGLSHSDS